MAKKDKLMTVDLETLAAAHGGDGVDIGRQKASGYTWSWTGYNYNHGNGYTVYEPGISGRLLGYKSTVTEDPEVSLQPTGRGTVAETPAGVESLNNARNHARGYNKRWPGLW